MANKEKKSKIDMFCEETSMIGFPYISTEYKTWFR